MIPQPLLPLFWDTEKKDQGVDLDSYLAVPILPVSACKDIDPEQHREAENPVDVPWKRASFPNCSFPAQVLDDTSGSFMNSLILSILAQTCSLFP